MLAISMVLFAAGCFATTVATVSVGRHQAASAADLAALAAAGKALEGQPAACRAAAVVTAAVRATLLACSLQGEIAEVTVERRPMGRLGQWGAAHSTARAGPSRSSGTGPEPADDGVPTGKAILP